MKKLLIAAFAAATIAAPAMAGEATPKATNLFFVKASRIVNGTRHITAVREDGRKKAFIKVSQSGEVTASVDGKPVRATLKDL